MSYQVLTKYTTEDALSWGQLTNTDVVRYTVTDTHSFAIKCSPNRPLKMIEPAAVKTKTPEQQVAYAKLLAHFGTDPPTIKEQIWAQGMVSTKDVREYYDSDEDFASFFIPAPEEDKIRCLLP